MDAIRTEELSKSFGTIAAVDRVTFSIAEGELFGLVGPDGAGKTTLLRMLAGVMDSSGGAAWVAGHSLEDDSDALKDHIAYMSQRFALYPDLTVLENIQFYADIYGVSRTEREQGIERLLKFANLTAFKKRLAGNLSGGMKQKLALSCALVHKPRVLMLDEPTNGVDPVSRRDLWRILYSLLRERVTILVSTAYLDEAERCNRIGLMHEGRLIACGTPEDVKQRVTSTLLEVRCDKSREAVRALREVVAHESIGIFGDRLHVMVQDDRAGEESIRKTLEAAHIEVASIRRIEPALEDVFVSMMEIAEGRATP